MLEELIELHEHHVSLCAEYRKVTSTLFPAVRPSSLDQLPFIHVSAFKGSSLVSMRPTHRTMQSSGTSGNPSTIMVTSNDCLRQSKSLASIFSAHFGPRRRNIVVVDQDIATLVRDGVTARAAAVAGFVSLCRNPQFMIGNYGVPTLLDKPVEVGAIAFGFTTYVWEHRRYLEQLTGKQVVVLHGGGWKRLSASGVSREAFNAELLSIVPDASVVNYYGMIEQAGVVYFDCLAGRFHEHDRGTFIARDTSTLEPSHLGMGQFFSTVPQSYPGYSLLTDDMIEIVDSCECGSPGRAFRFMGRRVASESRGCANV